MLLIPIGVLQCRLSLADAADSVERLYYLTAVEGVMKSFQDVIATGKEFVAREWKVEYPRILLLSDGLLSARRKPTHSGHQTSKCLLVVEPAAEINPGEETQKGRQCLFIPRLRSRQQHGNDSKRFIARSPIEGYAHLVVLPSP